MFTIYHNPRCTKSRQTLALLEEAGVELIVVHYLDTPPTEDEIQGLLNKLGMTAHELVRKQEEAYKTAGLSKESDDLMVIRAMASYPKLIERPIVTKGDQAVVGRPPENVKALLS